MQILLCIDDTDNLNTPGTGHLAESLINQIEKKGWGNFSAISRHQLFVHEDIPYTSHNSAMCAEATIDGDYLGSITDLGIRFLETESAEGSDPGICVTVIDDRLDHKSLMDFGAKAKNTVLTKEEAYGLAKSSGVHLSEHGGTGDGIIGALAGTGLRLAGNDGRFRGWHHIGLAGGTITVKALCDYEFIDSVRSESGRKLQNDDVVEFGGDRIKRVLQNFEQTLLVTEKVDNSNGVKWKTLTKAQVKKY